MTLGLLRLSHAKVFSNFIPFQARLFSSSELKRDKLNVLFFGTDSFSVTHLNGLYNEMVKEGGNGIIKKLSVVAPPDPPFRSSSHRQVPIRVYANETGLKVYDAPVDHSKFKFWQVPKDTDEIFDIGIVVSFGYFFTENIIKSFPLGTINVHPSLLPKYRGAAPIQHTILNQDKETGVSIIELHPEKWDCGRILHQKRFPVEGDVDFVTLRDKLALLGTEELIHTIKNYSLLSQNPIVQDDSLASRAGKIKKEMGILKWKLQTAGQIYALARAISHQASLYTSFGDLSVRLEGHVAPQSAETLSLNSTCEAGTYHYHKPSQTLYVKCSDNNFMGFKSLQVTGKPIMNAFNFYRGYKQKFPKFDDPL